MGVARLLGGVAGIGQVQVVGPDHILQHGEVDQLGKAECLLGERSPVRASTYQSLVPYLDGFASIGQQSLWLRIKKSEHQFNTARKVDYLY